MIELPRSLKRNQWQLWHLVGAMMLAALGVAVQWDAWADILRIGLHDEEASHMFLVPIVMAWLIFVRKERLRQCRPTGQWVGPLIVAIGWAVGYLGYHHAMQSLWHGGAVMVAVGCFLSVMGREILEAFFPAFVVMIFLVPVPAMIRHQIAIPLQNALARVTEVGFDLLGMAIQRSGNLLVVNDKPVGIAEACNGMRMVFALFLVSYAFAFGHPLRQYVRAIILIASPVLALVCNVLRLVPTVWLYGYGKPAVAQAFHDISGWAMVFLAFMLLLAIVRLLKWALLPISQYTLAYD